MFQIDAALAWGAERQVAVAGAVVVAEMDVAEPVGQCEQILARHAACSMDVAVADVEGQPQIGQPEENFSKVFELV